MESPFPVVGFWGGGVVTCISNPPYPLKPMRYDYTLESIRGVQSYMYGPVFYHFGVPPECQGICYIALHCAFSAPFVPCPVCTFSFLPPSFLATHGSRHPRVSVRRSARSVLAPHGELGGRCMARVFRASSSALSRVFISSPLFLVTDDSRPPRASARHGVRSV